MMKAEQRHSNTATRPAVTGSSGHVAPEDQANSTKLTEIPLRFASWNVRNLSSEYPALLSTILQHDTDSIACLQEMRLNGN